MSTTLKILAAVAGIALVAVVWLTFGSTTPVPDEAQPERPAKSAKKLAPDRGGDDDTRAARLEEFSERRRAMRDHRMAESDEPGSAKPRPERNANIAGKGERFSRRMPEESGERPAAAPPLESFETVKHEALSNPDPDERIRAVESMSFFEDESAMGVLSVALTDSDAEVRLAALEEISIISENPPLPLLETAMRDSDPEMRSTALRLLSDSEDEGRWPLIKAALQDPDEDVRSEAEDIVEMDSDDTEQ